MKDSFGKLSMIFCAVALFALPLAAQRIMVDGLCYNTSGDNAIVTHPHSHPAYPDLSGEVVIPPTVVINSKTYTVTEIDASAFSGCTEVTSFVLPSTLKKIGDYAFYGCTGITSIRIPVSVAKMSRSAFKDCAGLTTVYWDPKNCDIGEYLYSPFSKESYGMVITTFKFGNQVERIPMSLCQNLTELAEIDIPASVTYIGRYAFSGCKNAKGDIDLSRLNDYGVGIFTGCANLTSVKLPNNGYISDNAFFLCSSLTSITFPDGLTNIGKEAFKGTGLTSVAFPNTLRRIGDEAFADCTGLTTVTIPGSVRTVHPKAFARCTNLTSVYWNAVDGGYKREHSNDYLGYKYAMQDAPFGGCNNISTLVFGEGVEVVPENIMYDNEHAIPYHIKKLVIPSTVKSIGYNAFRSDFTDAEVYIFIADTSAVVLGEQILGAYTVIYPPITSDLEAGRTETHSPELYYDNATLYVPRGSVEQYSNADPWNRFPNIVEIEVKGDVNGDCAVDGSDNNAIINMILGRAETTAYGDVNDDGSVDGSDVNFIIRKILGE